MVYAAHSPFQVLSTQTMDYALLQKFNRFAKFWDLYANSGNFPGFTQILRDRGAQNAGSFFRVLWEFTEYLANRHADSFGISLLNLVESAWIYGSQEFGLEPDRLREILIADYSAGKKRDVPHFLRTKSEIAAPAAVNARSAAPASPILPPRQARRLQVAP